MTEPQATSGSDGFEVHLDVFEGPFDLLLGLIAKHQLDVTEVSLSKVTDEFISYINRHEREWDLDQATHFLVVAATLLDLKAARLLPSGEVEDEADLELLEARDLLFARLLQYRAYKEVAAIFAAHMADQGRRFPRTVPLEPRFAEVRPELRLDVTPEGLARLAARALAPKPKPAVSVGHIYSPVVSVQEQANILVTRLRGSRRASFRGLIADCAGTYEVVARFLALLELYRVSAIAFDQVEPLGELLIRWCGPEEGDIEIDGDSGDKREDSGG